MSRWERWAPLAGVIAVALWIVGLICLTHDAPPSHPTDVRILAYYKAETNWILVGGWLFMVGTLFFVWFAGALRARLQTAEGAPGTFTTIAFAGAVAAGVFGMATGAGDVDGAINKNDITAATAGTLHNLGDAFFVGAELSAVLLFLGAALVAFRTGILPRWWAILMVIVAIVLVIGPIGWAALIFGVPIWTLGTAAMLLRAPRLSQSSAATA